MRATTTSNSNGNCTTFEATRSSTRAFEASNRCVVEFLFANGSPEQRIAHLFTCCESDLADGSTTRLDFHLAELLIAYRDSVNDPRAAIQAYRAFRNSAGESTGLPLSELELSKCYSLLGTSADKGRTSLAELVQASLAKAS